MSTEKIAPPTLGRNRDAHDGARPQVRAIHIALVAQARKEPELANFVRMYEGTFRAHRLYAASRTRLHIEEAVAPAGPASIRLPFVPLGERQIYPMIERGEMDLVILLVDPCPGARDESPALELLHLCDAQGIPIATNVVTAGLLLRALATGESLWTDLMAQKTRHQGAA